MTAVLQQLDAEWRDLAGSPGARRALIRWAVEHPILIGKCDLHAVLACRHDPAVAGDVLLALARLAPTDEVAARTVLQMLLPGIVRLVATIGHGDPDAADDLVSRAWERIRTYPTTRHGSVAANVVLDVRKGYLRARRTGREVALDAVSELRSTGAPPDEQVLGVLLLEDLAAAQRDGVVSEDVLRLIVRTRLWGEPLAEIAAEHDVKPQVLCQRRWRAERRLRELPLAG